MARAKAVTETRRRRAGEASAAYAETITSTLSFLDREIAQSPERIKPLSATRIDEARALTKDVKVTDDDKLPDDVTL